MEFLTRNTGNHDLLVILLSSCFALIAVSRLLFENRFYDFFELLKNGKYLVIYSKKNYNYDVFNSIFFTIQLISVSIFITEYLPNTNFFFTQHIFYCFFFLLGLIICKYLAEKLFFVILGIEYIYDHVIFQKITFRNLIGVLLCCINVLLFWVFDFSDTAVFTIAAIIVLLYLITTIIVYRNHLSIILNNLFYFILYLCALEIAPYFMLYKLMV